MHGFILAVGRSPCHTAPDPSRVEGGQKKERDGRTVGKGGSGEGKCVMGIVISDHGVYKS